MNVNDFSEFNPTQFTNKFICHFYLREGVSKIQSIQTVAKLCVMDIRAAKYMIERSHILAFLGCERFISIVLTKEEAMKVSEILEPYFYVNFYSAGPDTLTVGNFFPWNGMPTASELSSIKEMPKLMPLGDNR